jgi:low temperature requirement protein LtrA
MVWLLWVYTTWVANWPDPRRISASLRVASARLTAGKTLAIHADPAARSTW